MNHSSSQNVIKFILLMTCLAIVTIAEDHFFCIINLSASSVTRIQIFFSLLAFCLTITKTKINANNIGYLFKYFVIIVLFLLSQFLYTMIKYPAGSIRDFIQAARSYFWIILTFPIYYIITKKRDGFRRLCDMLSIIVVISLGILLLIALFYNNSNGFLFNIEEFYTLQRRNNRLRLWDLSSLEGFIALWLFYKFLYAHKKRILYIIGLLIIIGALIYVEQTRVMLISIFLCIFIMFISKQSKKWHELFYKILLIIVVIAGIVYIGLISDLFNSFSVTGHRPVSTINRIDEILYSFELIKQNPIMGTGLVSYTVNNLNDNYHGYDYFEITDIGVIGLITQIGIGAFFVYIFPMIRFGYILMKTRAYHNKEPYPYLFSVFIFLIFTSGTLVVMNPQRIFAWPFCLAFFEYWNSKCKSITIKLNRYDELNQSS